EHAEHGPRAARDAMDNPGVREWTSLALVLADLSERHASFETRNHPGFLHSGHDGFRPLARGLRTSGAKAELSPHGNAVALPSRDVSFTSQRRFVKRQ